MPETVAQTIHRWLSEGDAELVITLNEKGEIYHVGVGGIRIDYTLHDYRKGTNCEFCHEFVLKMYAGAIRTSPSLSAAAVPICQTCIAKLTAQEAANE